MRLAACSKKRASGDSVAAPTVLRYPTSATAPENPSPAGADKASQACVPVGVRSPAAPTACRSLGSGADPPSFANATARRTVQRDHRTVSGAVAFDLLR